MQQAAQGGPTEQAQLLRERLRRGLLEKRHVEMAAYLGDEISRLALEQPEECPACEDTGLFDGEPCGECDFSPWVAGLTNVGAQSEEVTRSVPDREFLIRCVVAAARVVLAEGCPHGNADDLLLL